MYIDKEKEVFFSLKYSQKIATFGLLYVFLTVFGGPEF